MTNRKRILRTGILYAILAFGVVLRLGHSENNFRFGVDQYYELRILKNISSDVRLNPFSLPIRGQAGSYPYLLQEDVPSPEFTVYNGILYTYMLLPVALLTNTSPYALVLYYITLNSITVLIMFHCGKMLIDNRTGYIAALLTASSYWLNAFSRTFWTPSAVPFFVSLSLLGIITSFRKSSGWWWLAFLGASAASQVHNSGYVYLLFVLVYFVISGTYKTLSHRQWVISLFALLVPLFPTIIAEAQTQFQTGQALIQIVLFYITTHSNTTPKHFLPGVGLISDIARDNLMYYLVALGHLTRSSIMIPLVKSIIAGLLSVLILPLPYFLLFPQNKKTQKIVFSFSRHAYLLFLVWIVLFSPIPWLVKNYYNQQNFDTTTMLALLPGIPVIYLILSIRLRYLFVSGSSVRFTGLVLMCAVIIVNAANVYTRMWKNSFSEYNYGDMANAARSIADESNGQPYELTVSFHNQEAAEILYFFETYNLPFPERFNGSSLPRKNNPSEKVLRNSPASLQFSLMLRDDETGDKPAAASIVQTVGNFDLYRTDHETEHE